MTTNARSLQDLALQLVTALNSDSSKSQESLEVSARRVTAQLRSSGGSMRKEWHEVRATLKGLSRTARIRVEDDVASSYAILISKLAEHRRRGGTQWDEDLPLQASNIPQHVHLLLELSQPVNAQAQSFAEEYLNRPPPSKIKSDLRLYREIMAPPFTGDHWGPGYDEEVSEGWTESGSEGSDTPSEDEIVTPAPKPRSAAQLAREAEAARRAEEEQRILLAKITLRERAKGAYWQTGGKEVPSAEGLCGWQALSSLPAIASPGLQQTTPRAISSSELQRELLFALSGRPGIMLSFDSEGVCSIVPHHAEVSAYTPSALEGILMSFAESATQAARLRRFVADTLAPTSLSPSSPRSETCEAFASAIAEELHALSKWVVDREAAFMGSAVQTISTPLVLHRDFSSRYSDILESLVALLPLVDSPISLLDALYDATRSPVNLDLRPGLTRIFVASAAPMWAMTGSWLVQGMPVPEALSSPETLLEDGDGERSLPAEFYIQRDRDAAWVDEDFWEAGFVVSSDGWPAWLEPVRAEVLEGGKARGMLHSLPAHEGDQAVWKGLEELVKLDHGNDLAEVLCDFVRPICCLSQRTLSRVLETECGLASHLSAIDGLSLMRGAAFDVLDTWADWLFGHIASGKPADFHLLTHSLRDTIETLGAGWMNAPAARARTSRRRAELSDIRVDYLVPFPLSQVFTATAMDLRSDVFTFLLRLLRARKLLLRARGVAELQAGGRMDVLIPLRRLRHAANWALDTLWTWINAVLDIQAARHRGALSGASFHAMVNLELEHGRRLVTICFLHASTDNAMQHVSAILEASEALYSVASTTLGVSLPQRRRPSVEESESEVETEDEEDVVEKKAEEETDPVARLERIAESVGRHVRGLRDEVERLAAEGNSDATSEMWGMLVFALQDWKDVVS